jgi:penicillin-binding protein 2
MIPSPFWKEEVLKDRWYLGDTYNLSIGQGSLLVTPIQTVAATAAFANNGQMCDLHLLKGQSPSCQDLHIRKETVALVKEGMKQACSTGGTGWPLFDFSVSTGSAHMQVSCKTGTAEARGPEDSPHAWITVYAPSEDPQIVVTVLIENGGQGSDVAGPIAKEILRTYLKKK